MSGDSEGKPMIEVARNYTLDVRSPMPITSERQHREYLSVLDKLGSKESPTSEEEKYARVLITLVEAYEEAHDSIPDASPVEVLGALMDANNLRQKDLGPIFGSESIVSEVLHGKRELNRTHIEKLSKRFRVSPAVFFLAADMYESKTPPANSAYSATGKRKRNKNVPPFQKSKG